MPLVSHNAESEKYRHLEMYGLGCSLMYDATFTLQKSSPGLSKRTFRRYFLSQDFILSIEMIIFGILMNLAFSWFDTSVSMPSKLENTFGYQESGPQKMGACPC